MPQPGAACGRRANLQDMLASQRGFQLAQDILGFGALTPAGRTRLRKWLNDVLLYPEHIERFAEELEYDLEQQLEGCSPYVGTLPLGKVREGMSREFQLEPGDFSLPVLVSASTDNAAPDEPKPFYWKHLTSSERAAYIAAAAVVFENGGRFVTWGDNYKALLSAVKISPLPLQFQKVVLV
jgi:hypothetical protein